MKAFFSVLGMYNHEDEIFTDFRVPAGLDKETAIHKILFDNAELGLIYTDPEIFPVLIKNWTDSNFYSWERAYQALHSQYNPIHNYDRTEEWTDDETGTNSASESGTNADTRHLTREGDETGNGSGQIDTSKDETSALNKRDVVTHSEAGYNEGNTPVYAYDDVTEGLDTTTTTGETHETNSDEYTVHSESEDNETNNGQYSKTGSGNNTKNAEHEGHVYGNIGVTTTQKMIEEEMELRTKYNLYDMISMSFRSNFCIMVY